MIGLEYISNLYNVKYVDISKILGLSRQTFNSWIKKRRYISEKHLPELSKIFNIPEEFFQKELTEEDKIIIQEIKLEQDKLNNNINIGKTIVIEKEVIPENAIIIDEKYKKLYNKFDILINNVDSKILEDTLNNLIKLSGIKEK